MLHSRLCSSHRSSVVNGMLVPAETLVTTVYSSTLIAKCPYFDSQVNVVYFPTLMVKFTTAATRAAATASTSAVASFRYLQPMPLQRSPAMGVQALFSMTSWSFLAVVLKPTGSQNTPKLTKTTPRMVLGWFGDGFGVVLVCVLCVSGGFWDPRVSIGRGCSWLVEAWFCTRRRRAVPNLGTLARGG